MAESGLTTISHRHDLFCRYVVTNLSYWQAYVAAQATDIAALDRGRERILTAIAYAFSLEETWPTVRTLIETLAAYMERRGYWDAWQAILTKAIAVAQRVDDQVGEVNLSTLLARLLFQQSCDREAICVYRRTIRLTRQIGDSFNQARAYTNLGYYFIEQGQWSRAEILCDHALQIFKQIDNLHGQAHTENHLGILYSWQPQRWDEAQQHLEQACVLWQAMNDSHGLMRGLINLSGLYIRLKQPNEALDYLATALEHARATGEEVIIGRIYINLGIAHRLNHDLVKAEAYLKQAETIFKRFSNLTELARVWNHLGLTYAHRPATEPAAIFCLTNAMKVWSDLGNVIEQAEVLLDIVEFELTRGSRKTAAIRLAEVENLIGDAALNSRHRHLHTRLTQYRRSLLDYQLTSYDLLKDNQSAASAGGTGITTSMRLRRP